MCRTAGAEPPQYALIRGWAKRGRREFARIERPIPRIGKDEELPIYPFSRDGRTGVTYFPPAVRFRMARTEGPSRSSPAPADFTQYAPPG